MHLTPVDRIETSKKNESPNLELRRPVLDDSFKYSSLGKAPIWSVTCL